MPMQKIYQFGKEISYDTKSWMIENFKKYEDENRLNFKNLAEHYHTSCTENIFLGRKTINTKI